MHMNGEMPLCHQYTIQTPYLAKGYYSTSYYKRYSGIGSKGVKAKRSQEFQNSLLESSYATYTNIPTRNLLLTTTAGPVKEVAPLGKGQAC